MHPITKATLIAGAMVTVSLAADVTAAADPGPCDSSEHRQFDFWVGDWNVYTPDGKLAGVNSITREYGGCVLHEHYSNPRGYTGESLNAYDAGRKVWHQTWVDTDGTLLLLEGRLRRGNMVLAGQVVGPKGEVTKHRITWTPNADGTVRQHWQTSDKQGAWTTAFDGKYKRK